MIEINFGLSVYIRHEITNILGEDSNIVKIPEMGKINPRKFWISDYQGFKKIKPERIESLERLPAVKMTRVKEFGYWESLEIILLWIESRGEWVGVYHRCWCEAVGVYGEYTSGPFALDKMCSRKILQAYGLTEGRFRPEEVKQMSPEKLKASL